MNSLISFSIKELFPEPEGPQITNGLMAEDID
jgi:hypothetical protein